MQNISSEQMKNAQSVIKHIQKCTKIKELFFFFKDDATVKRSEKQTDYRVNLLEQNGNINQGRSRSRVLKAEDVPERDGEWAAWSEGKGSKFLS